jgi:hypothetical protein
VSTGLALSRRGVLVTAFGNDPDGNAGPLLRVWEQSGRAGDLTLTLPQGLKATQAAPVNLRGEPLGKALGIVDGTFTIPLPASAPAGFVLTKRKASRLNHHPVCRNGQDDQAHEDSRRLRPEEGVAVGQGHWLLLTGDARRRRP